MSIANKNNVHLIGDGDRSIIFSHGLGCDQHVWSKVVPAFAHDHRVVLFDHVGAGGSDLSAFSPQRYSTLHSYAADLLAICRHYELRQPVFVGHSVSGVIGMLAAIEAPELFESVVMLAPSPCYINDGDYVGGFTRTDIEDLLDLMDSNYLGWTSTMANLLMLNARNEEVERELAQSFCRTDPDIARHFATVTFLSDHRADLPRMKTRSLLLQTGQDIVAPLSVARYMHKHMPASELRTMRAVGHCPHLSDPTETITLIRNFID